MFGTLFQNSMFGGERHVTGAHYTAEADILRAVNTTIVGPIPRSRNCTNYDGTSCDFLSVCDQNPGWEDPGTMGLYEMRRPHHAPERQAFEEIRCGIPCR